jgi:hypothetical protein
VAFDEAESAKFLKIGAERADSKPAMLAISFGVRRPWESARRILKYVFGCRSSV